MAGGTQVCRAGRWIVLIFALAASVLASGRVSAQGAVAPTPPDKAVPAATPPATGTKTPPVAGAPDAPKAPSIAPASPPQASPPPASPPSASRPPAAAAPASPKPDTPAPKVATPPPPGPAPAPQAPAPQVPKTGDASSAKALTLPALPVALVKGEGKWDDGFQTIMASIQTIQDALAKANIKQVGHPLTVFRETTDDSFMYEAMIPIDPATDKKTVLSSNVAFGDLPAGKVLKFQHRGAYDEIDSTYEAITAYLDEKGFDTKNVFIEEYLNTVKTSDDASLQVDIYVFIK